MRAVKPPCKVKSAANDAGAVTVEAALVLPLFFLICLAVLDFGSVLYQQTTFAQLLRQTARSIASEQVPDPSDQTSWNVWKTASVQSPIYSGLSSGMIGQVRTLRPTLGTIADSNGNVLGCGVRIEFEAGLTCLSCKIIRPLGARGDTALLYRSAALVPLEGQTACPGTVL